MKIMIVDDETVSRKILIQKMARIGSCTAVDDGLTAMELFDKALKAKAPFDLITLDVSMPKMDGRQLLSLIRRREKAVKIPKDKRVKIIMVTSRMNVSTIKECIKLGCDGYISKPVNNYQLLENLGRMGLAPPEENHQKDEKPHAKIIAQIIRRFYRGEIRLPVLPETATGLISTLADYLANRTGFAFFSLEQMENESDPDIHANLKSLEPLRQLGLSTGKAMEIADEAKAVIRETAAAF